MVLGRFKPANIPKSRLSIEQGPFSPNTSLDNLRLVNYNLSNFNERPETETAFQLWQSAQTLTLRYTRFEDLGHPLPVRSVRALWTPL